MEHFREANMLTQGKKKMKRSGVGALLVVFVVVQLMIMVAPGMAINCGQVDSCLAPCVSYLTNGGTPVPACCTGLKSITAMASDLNEKRDACKCVKNAVNRVSNLKDGAALSLPQKCGVHMNIPISQTINCDA
ncbi:hypothetical protein LguiB_011067 [Lonicera macranthoides]